MAAAIGLMAGCEAADEIESDLEPHSQCEGACEVALDTLAVIGAAAATLYPRADAGAVRDNQGRYFVAPTDRPGAVAVYSSRGELLHSFGRPGQGPGEYDLEFARLHRGRGDSISVVDAFALRRTIVGPSGEVVRSHTLPSIQTGFFQWRGLDHFEGTIRGADGRTRLIHQIGPAGAVVHSGVEVPDGRALADAYRARTTSGDTLWLARRTEYRIEAYDSMFQVVRTIAPSVTWFPDHQDEFADATQQPPSPVIQQMSADSSGLLWVIITVADKDWQPLEDVGERQVSVGRSARLRDWIIDVVDLRSGERIATRRMDWPVALGEGDGLLYLLSEGVEGQGVLTATIPRVTGLNRRD